MTSENKRQLIDLLREYQAEIQNEFNKITRGKPFSELTKSESIVAVLMGNHIQYIDEIVDVLLYDV